MILPWGPSKVLGSRMRAMNISVKGFHLALKAYTNGKKGVLRSGIVHSDSVPSVTIAGII